MPTWVKQQLQQRTISQLLPTPPSDMRTIFTELEKNCQEDQNIEQAYLCHTGVKHVVMKLGLEGLGGYHNIQMMISYLLATHYSQGYKYFQGRLPRVLRLQDLIEEAWDKGINSHGRIETGGIRGTRKWIGTPEVTAAATI
jgi:zinc finger-containing ubiquitin peptidase 1